mgnify:CR=1 FL=1
MKKIIFGITGLTLGGAERVLVDIANKLVLKYDVTIFTIYAGGELEKELDQRVHIISLFDFKYNSMGKFKKRIIPIRVLLEKKKIFKNFIYWTQSTSSVKLGITTDTGVTKSMNYFTSDYSYYSNQHDFSVNMGYSEENVTSVTVTFQKIGVYSYDDIQIVCQPMDSYTDEINTLKENVLTDVELGNNKVTGQITLDRNKYLCLTIPYSKGWKVYVDGERQKLYNANGQYMAVYLTSGTHNVTLKYSTPLLKEGALVSLAGVAIFAMQLVINKRKKRE